MKKHGECISTSLGNQFHLGVLYSIMIDETKGIFKVSNGKYSEEYLLEDLTKYFKIILTQSEFIELMKTNLGIVDEEIIEFRNNGEDTICMKYKHDLMYIKFLDKSNTFTLAVNIEITSNNLARQKTFTIELFEDDINKFCNLLKLMHK